MVNSWSPNELKRREQEEEDAQRRKRALEVMNRLMHPNRSPNPWEAAAKYAPGLAGAAPAEDMSPAPWATGDRRSQNMSPAPWATGNPQTLSAGPAGSPDDKADEVLPEWMWRWLGRDKKWKPLPPEGPLRTILRVFGTQDEVIDKLVPLQPGRPEKKEIDPVTKKILNDAAKLFLFWRRTNGWREP